MRHSHVYIVSSSRQLRKRNSKILLAVIFIPIFKEEDTMATAKKLPSGSWRCLVYSHTEKVWDSEKQKMKDKRIYESFTSDDPTLAGKKQAELSAAQFMATKTPNKQKQRKINQNMTLSEAIDKYIDSRKDLNRSPTTVQDYECIKRNAFQDIMCTKLKDLDEKILQEAINVEAKRPSNLRTREQKPISAKRLRNEWGLVSAVLHKYAKWIDFDEFELPAASQRVVNLPPAREVLRIIKGTSIELPVLLAIWLSFSMSEVLGLTKSKSISGDYLTIREVVVTVNNKPYRKDIAKNETRNRTHRIPTYIKELIDKVDGDVLVPLTGNALYRRWIKLQDDNNMEHITFHDLRHLNASVMALLRIPDKYAQERGGWKSDNIMKKVYMQTFPEERVKVDDKINTYFEEAMQHEMQHE